MTQKKKKNRKLIRGKKALTRSGVKVPNQKRYKNRLAKRKRTIREFKRKMSKGQKIPDDIKKLLTELENAAKVATRVSDPNNANLEVQKTVAAADIVKAAAEKVGVVYGGKIEGAVEKQVAKAKTHARKQSAGVKTPSVKRNPGLAFEKWVEINWNTIVSNSSGCITAPLALSVTDNCSKEWFDLTTPPTTTPPTTTSPTTTSPSTTSPSFTRNKGSNPTDGTPFGKCDFTNIPSTTPSTPPAPPPPPLVFIECKAKGGASSINLSARCYALLEAAIAASKDNQRWVIICRDYQWNPPTPPTGTTATEFQPNEVIIIGPDVLNALIPPTGTPPSRSPCCPINNGTSTPVPFTNLDHPVGGTPRPIPTVKHTTKVEIYA